MTAGPIASAIYGAWRLANLDPGGIAYIDRSPEGALRSFLAAIYLAPPFVVLLVLRQSDLVDPFRYYAVHSLAYVVGWTVFPLAMVGVARLIGREKFYLSFIAAYNWSALLQNGVHFAVAFLAEAEIFNPNVLAPLSLVITVIVAGYAWFVTRVALNAPAGAAGAIVFLDILLGILIERVATKIV